MASHMASPLLPRQHIQDHGEANTYHVPHFGYSSRVLPCSSGQGTCEYLDGVYWMHDISMLYSFIMWGVLLGIAVVWVTLRGWRMGGPEHGLDTWFDKMCDGINTAKRRWLMRDTPWKWLFGRTSRLQVLILVIMCVYLTIFSLVGIVYQTWMTPVEGTNLMNRRSGIGGWADRVSVLAYALTPLTILLAMRESILSSLTGIPYQHFNFLHRWCGRIIAIQSCLHTLGWVLIEGRFYEPQPEVWNNWVAQMYAIFGVAALVLILLMVILSTKTAIRYTGYEFFKITHWILAILYIGACWGHWDRLWCWMVPSLALIVVDDVVRGLRILYIHMGGKKGGGVGFKCAQADVEILGEGDDIIARLDFDYEHSAWEAGQHFHLTFPSLSIWQSHPFTPGSVPNEDSGIQHHTYIIRLRKGQTAELTKHATLPVILTGPYGHAEPKHETRNVLAVSGGTGVTFTYPSVVAMLRQNIFPRAMVDFVWVVRASKDLLWLQPELLYLKSLLKSHPSLRVSIAITRELEPSATPDSKEKVPVVATPLQNDEKCLAVTTQPASSGTSTPAPPSALEQSAATAQLLSLAGPRFSIEFLGDHHPSPAEYVADFMERAGNSGGNVAVIGSGPEAMGSDLRDVMAGVRHREPVSFYWDSRD